ncbi:MAG: ABC transporter ATP-binding protein [Rhodospirillaceae bacterium]|nr:ABC transporter ATP-binding protein [Rhodospirillaceae bacterium]
MSAELKAVVKRVGAETHIYETSVALADKGFNVLLGPTGAGKTTLIKLLAGLEKATSGQIWIKGRDVTHVNTQRRNISLVHQFFVNYPNMSVYENIASPLRVAGLRRQDRDRRVREAAELLKLTPMLNRRPSELSGGQQQRTALARAIVKEADLVLLDEPLANLDYKLREELRDELPKLFAGRGATVVYATSEPTEALLLGGHTATMQDGRVTHFGPTAEIYRAPADLATAEVFSDPPINTAPVTKTGTRMTLDGGVGWTVSGPIADVPDGTYTVGVRPHFITPRANGEGLVRLSGKVLITELSGSDSVAHFRVGRHVWVSQSRGIYQYRVGEMHDFLMDADRCLYFDAKGMLVG